ncbi:complement regulator-acquiring protein, partial [Borreliella garinii]
MTNTKLNIIKLNIITAILTLIFISCAPINKIGPKPK